MEFLGIGPLELLFILLVALILLGPKDMAKTGRTVGRTLRKVVTSPQWKTINQTSKEIRNLPTRLIREAGLEEVEQDLNNLKKTTAEIQKTIRESTTLPPGLDKPGSIDRKIPATEKSEAERNLIPGKASTSDETSNRPGSSAPTIAPEPDLSPWIEHPDEDNSIVDYSQNRTAGLAAWVTSPVVISSPPPPTKSDPSETISS